MRGARRITENHLLIIDDGRRKDGTHSFIITAMLVLVVVKLNKHVETNNNSIKAIVVNITNHVVVSE
jgi:hypothetical protein